MSTAHEVVSREAWTEARKELLVREKELNKKRDELSAARRDLPWVEITDNYMFEGVEGKVTLADLFAGKSQLIIQHFMFGPDWEEGCPSCSYLADSHDGINIHLNQRDINMVVISNGPLDKLVAYKKRMGWAFDWLSSMGTSFNYDFDVSFSEDDHEKGTGVYNYQPLQRPMSELPGFSCFYKDDDGKIYHTYSTFAGGLDPIISADQYMDLTAKGRNESEFDFPMAWIRRHDQYE
tara:strand:+ start:155724 stop:156431 length:708 start_codon:yes stop_codon:yes gene_type:complete